MDKNEFIRNIRKGLDGIPEEDINHWCEYYSELIYDRIDEGMSEEEAVLTLGDTESIVKEILADTSFVTLVKRKVKKKSTYNGLGITAIIIGAPVWIPILIAVIAVLLSLYVTLWSIVISVWAVTVSFFASSLGTLFLSIRYLIETGVYEFFIAFGITLFLIGMGIVANMFSKLITKVLINLTKVFIRKLKLLFTRKGVIE